MDVNIIEGAVDNILTKTIKLDEPDQASVDLLLKQGDTAVPPIVSRIEKYESRMEEERAKHNYTIFYGFRTATQLLGKLNSELSRKGLVQLLNTRWSGHIIYGMILDALDMCGNEDLVPGLIQAIDGPCVQIWPEKFIVLYLMVRKLGGYLPLSVEQAVKIASNLPFTEEALRIIDDFAKDIPSWPAGRQSAFFWFYGIRVESVHSLEAARPYFAASLLANPSENAAAWTKFEGITRSEEEARKLAKKYPLPEPFPQPSKIPQPSNIPQPSEASKPAKKKWWPFS